MLSEQQRKAVESTDKIVLVAAAAGSGKTRVIIEHIKFLINNGEDPSKIYAITYTNSAAQEMLLSLARRSLIVKKKGYAMLRRHVRESDYIG